jgi:hypothetical protein
MPASISDVSFVSQGTDVPTTLIPGMPLLDAAERASVTKPLLASNTTGLPKSSIAMPLYTRNFVQDPQSPTARMAASTPFAQAMNRSRFAV